MSEQPQQNQLWNIIGTVVTQKEVEGHPGLFKLTLELPVPLTTGIGEDDWRNCRGHVFFNQIVTPKNGATDGFHIFIHCLEMRKTPVGMVAFIVRCCPFEPGNKKRIFRADS